jgi:dethiobiotin synthetase
VAVLVVTGTGTGVGKTVVTAALAALAINRGVEVAVVKPAQTGLRPDEPGDLEDVRRLAGATDLHEFVRYPDPLSPAAAARRSGEPTLDLHDVSRRIADLAETRRLVLVEGAGGLLVPMGVAAWTVADLASALDAEVVVVARAGLGTLNHTALTLEALERRDIGACVVIGAWPATPELVHRTNRAELAGELAGVLPDGAPDRADFRAAAATWLAPALYGTATGLRDA